MRATAERFGNRGAAFGNAPSNLSEALVRAMVARDPGTMEHSERVQRRAMLLAREAGITDRLLVAIEGAALLHDIGKLGIPDFILQKAGPLTADEYEQVKAHPSIGADILSAAAFPSALTLIVRHHHENWDGTGYPDRLRGEEIPLGARIVSIVDCYDAMTSDRPYRNASSHASAMSMIHQRRGTMYDPELADAFLRMGSRVRPGSLLDSPVQPRARAVQPWLQARAV